MGPLKSEYGRRYRDPSWQTYVGHYLENVEYCSQRRQLENRHQPFDWWQDTDSDTTYTDDDEETPDNRGLQGKQDRARVTQKPCRHRPRSPEQPKSTNKDRHSHTLEEKNEKVQPNAEAVSGVKKPELKNKKSRNLKKKQGQQPERSAVTKKSTKLQTPKDPGNAPFIVYGWADERRAVGMKQTHNVKASISNRTSVYPGALNAQTRRLLNEEEERKKKQRRANNANRISRAYMQMVPPSSHWQTEYQRNYSH